MEPWGSLTNGEHTGRHDVTCANDNRRMYTADWVGRAIRKDVGGKDADAARMLVLMFASPPGIEERIARR